MSSKKKKILIPILGTIAALAVVTPIVVVSAAKTKRKDFKKQEKATTYDIFPKLDYNNYYRFIKIDDNGKEYIDENVVPLIVKDVLEKMNTSFDGKVSFDYKFVSKNHLELKFMYTGNNEEYYKTYTLRTKNVS
ncbi:hypothetical protein NPA07_04455 [Mycoplasmopsis caviae]|uniref:Membrane protein n=1 Tax=Mycoplasmopsis caviae TaxID=55603 RepID=A0A3P8MFA5_9BACT|nr:hypothetical protein [Mycoplasmopsis caviae]UUD35030.1 hypothetical protein NPA07_04455 [Mycoplasmopsis caviae]VDR42143.1 membrane protein [Mycoplasmopsis caviae]